MYVLNVGTRYVGSLYYLSLCKLGVNGEPH